MKIIRDRSGKLPIKLLIIVMVVVVVVGLGVTKFAKGGKKNGKKAPEKQVELSSWKLEEFVVNLRDANESRYLKVNMVLEVEGKLEGGEGGNPDEPKARDTIISVLTSKSFDDLESPQGKDHLKAELKSALNAELEKTKVANIYFTSFAMQ
jgi:flagellar protein FliL